MPARRAITPPPANAAIAITAIKVVRHDPRRVTVHIAGEAAARIWADDIHPLDLSVGLAWDDGVADRVAEAHARCEAARAAVRLISIKPRTASELVTKLRAKGHTPEHAKAAVDRLANSGLIDDAAVARSAAASIVARQPAGARLIEAKLRARGVTQQAARDAARDALADHDPLEDATALARKSARTMASLDRDVAKRRILGRLARRGFDTEIALAATAAALADRGG